MSFINNYPDINQAIFLLTQNMKQVIHEWLSIIYICFNCRGFIYPFFCIMLILQNLKYLILTVAFIFVSLITKGQSPLDEDGNQFNFSSGYTTAGIPVCLSYEMGIHPDISFGIEGSYRMFNEIEGDSTYNHSIAGITFFGNYYFNSMLKMDEKKMGLYAGLNFSYFKWFSPEGYVDKGKSSSSLAVGAQLGYRYYFGNFAAFVEGVGNTDHAGAKIGVSLKFR